MRAYPDFISLDGEPLYDMFDECPSLNELLPKKKVMDNCEMNEYLENKNIEIICIKRDYGMMYTIKKFKVYENLPNVMIHKLSGCELYKSGKDYLKIHHDYNEAIKELEFHIDSDIYSKYWDDYGENMRKKIET